MDTNLQTERRIQSVDFVRGLIMVIMALDHVRDFFHATSLTADPTDLNTTTPALFLTRWITHFCAPTFLFLSGVSAYLSMRNKSRSSSGIFLIKRGLWLVVADAVVMTFALSFNPHYNFIFLTVLWAIGWSMVLLGLFVRFAPRLILPVGLILYFGHNLFPLLHVPPDTFGGKFLRILFTGLVIEPIDQSHVVGFIYSILPWTAVMLLGFWFGRYITDKTKIFWTGVGLLALFVIVRMINMYGDPFPWQGQHSSLFTFFSFINTTKYPPSLLFLSMTLGPVLILLSQLGMKNSPLKEFVMTYGRVPLFFFILHFLLAHLLLIPVFYLTGHTNAEIVHPQSSFYFKPLGFGFDLPVVYLVWIIVVLLLYYPNRWFYRYKMEHNNWWLRYL
jgi:uncharacterized membrane protein